MTQTLIHFVTAVLCTFFFSVANAVIEGTTFTGYQFAVLFVLISTLFEVVAIRRKSNKYE